MKILTFCFLLTGLCFAQEVQFDFERAEALAQPGPEHAVLAKMAGEWQQEITYRFGGQVVMGEGVSKNEMILGGRFLRTETTTQMPGWPPAKSLTLMGYDRRHDTFTFIGMDSMGTYYVTATGTYDEAAKILTFSGEDQDETFVQKYRYTFKFLDDGTVKTEIIVIDHPGFGSGEKDIATVISTRKDQEKSGASSNSSN